MAIDRASINNILFLSLFDCRKRINGNMQLIIR